MWSLHSRAALQHCQNRSYLLNIDKTYTIYLGFCWKGYCRDKMMNRKYTYKICEDKFKASVAGL